ncbi:(2Fe-2S) ferredoxin domain-containing protein [Nocardioides marmorisolisilvae]|nr:(2Fe-2S) ferredoxin domain-containing protein [Nocardioides marmorisolisilvae]
MDEVLVVVGMSSREVSARDELAASARAAGGSLAFLQLADPSLSRELTRLADEGHRRIVLVGVSLGSMAPAASWLRRIAAAWWRERGPGAPAVEVATALASGTSLADLELARDVLRPLTGNEAGLTSPAWEDVPDHRHQVLLCRGPRCSALGADASAEALVLALMRAGLGDDDVLVTHTGCQFPCNQAPVVSVQPDDVWYGGVDPATAERIVTEHLLGGEPLAEKRLPRRSLVGDDR